jgi:hypothetical protein
LIKVFMSLFLGVFFPPPRGITCYVAYMLDCPGAGFPEMERGGKGGLLFPFYD